MQDNQIAILCLTDIYPTKMHWYKNEIIVECIISLNNESSRKLSSRTFVFGGPCQCICKAVNCLSKHLKLN